MTAGSSALHTEGPRCVCSPETGADDRLGVRARMGAEPSAVRTLRRRVRSWLEEIGADEEAAESILLVVDEAVTNAVEHACPGKKCDVELVVGSRACGRGLAVMVADTGEWQPPGDPGFRGRGLGMIRRIAERSAIETSYEGTTVRMCWAEPAVPGVH
ncbi:ATP-binding protein [Actinomycetospora atypica]|uniref:ATP-binding protein n=1 Tax=Actinomycetospora atypica TaxID=1290095 RepID=A0ABV9YKB5_9PSEU